MLTSPFALAVTSRLPVAGLTIAVTARFYSKDPSVRTYQQVYLVNKDGTAKRQLTFSRGDKTSVRWVGSDAIAYQERDRLYLQNIMTGKRSLLKKSSLWTAMPGSCHRGEPRWTDTQSTAEYVIKGGRLVVAPHPAPYAAGSPLRGDGWTLVSATGFQVNPSSPKLYSAGRMQSWPDLSEPNNEVEGLLYDRKNKIPYIVDLGGESTHGHIWSVVRLNTKLLERSTVASGVDVDFEPGMATLSAVGRRQFEALGSGFVWVSDLEYGTLEHGSDVIIEGLVYVTSVSLKPGSG